MFGDTVSLYNYHRKRKLTDFYVRDKGWNTHSSMANQQPHCEGGSAGELGWLPIYFGLVSRSIKVSEESVQGFLKLEINMAPKNLYIKS